MLYVVKKSKQSSLKLRKPRVKMKKLKMQVNF